MTVKLPGPTFPKTTKTGEWHMLAHESGVPKVSALPSELHRIAVPHEHGAQHNPTVFAYPHGLLGVVIRVLHGTRTTNYIAPLGPDGKIGAAKKMVCRVPAGELEDLRVFSWQERLWAVAATHKNVTAIRQTLLELSEDGSEILKVHVQPSGRHEKNWMPCVRGDNDLRLVYSTHPLVTMRVADRPGGVFAVPEATSIPQTTGHIRGGSQLIAWEGGFLAVVHQVHKMAVTAPGHNPMLGFWPPVVKDPVAGDAKVVYLHRFAFFNHELSQVVLGEPWYFRQIGIEFCAGLAKLGPNHFAAAFGVADKEAWIAKIHVKSMAATFAGVEGPASLL